MISRRFKNAVKLYPKRQYQLAWEAGVNPTTLSQIVTGCIRPKFDDRRVVAIGRLLGLKPEDCFEKYELKTECQAYKGNQEEIL